MTLPVTAAQQLLLLLLLLMMMMMMISSLAPLCLTTTPHPRASQIHDPTTPKGPPHINA
jgi:hypothetical protein